MVTGSQSRVWSGPKLYGGEEQENLDVYFDLLPQRRLCYLAKTFLLQWVGRRQQQQQERATKTSGEQQGAGNPVARWNSSLTLSLSLFLSLLCRLHYLPLDKGCAWSEADTSESRSEANSARAGPRVPMASFVGSSLPFKAHKRCSSSQI